MVLLRHSVKPRALVIEDDLWLKPLITYSLRAAIPDVVIQWAESIDEQLKEEIATSSGGGYSIIVADIHLSSESETGIDFWNHCQKECPEIPILLTSTISVDDFSHQLDGNSPYYLSKPFDTQQFQTVVQNLVGNYDLSS